MKNFILSFLGIAFLLSCAVPQMERRNSVEAPVTPEVQKKAQKEAQVPAEKTYKRKIAIGRFTNETNYGLGLLRDNDLDPLGKQASDILSSDLVRSERFIVLERPDLGKLVNEQQITHRVDLVGVDTLIIGSVSEFGRTTEGTSGFLSSTKKQRVHAKINIRLVDPETGHLFFSTTGAGEAVTESGEVAGFGSSADYDATLNDKAIRAAIANAMDSLITNIGTRPWRTNILSIEGKNVLIGGGSLQGLKTGDLLMVTEEGKKVRNPQSGFMITLPGREIARLKIESFFGTTETDQGSICSIVSGSLGGVSIEKAIVSEIPEKK